MGGRVISVAVAAGDTVVRGQTLAVIEAMKMEHRVVAGCGGVVQRVAIAAGGQVAAREIVVVITPEAAS
jgi:biotin carboxyl carrier protein